MNRELNHTSIFVLLLAALVGCAATAEPKIGDYYVVNRRQGESQVMGKLVAVDGHWLVLDTPGPTSRPVRDWIPREDVQELWRP
jgi:hypothetical protein